MCIIRSMMTTIQMQLFKFKRGPFNRHSISFECNNPLIGANNQHHNQNDQWSINN